MRSLIHVITHALGAKGSLQDIRPLPILDNLAKEYSKERTNTEEHQRLRDFIKRYTDKHGKY